MIGGGDLAPIALSLTPPRYPSLLRRLRPRAFDFIVLSHSLLALSPAVGVPYAY
jgi:hypothetical protein